MKPHEQDWRCEGYRYVERRDTTDTIAEVFVRNPESARPGDVVAYTRLIAAAPDMARAGLAIYARVEEAARAMPGARTADDLAAMDTSVTVPASLIRDLFAAMRSGGVLP